MRAFVYAYKDGKSVLGTGRVTPDYQNLKNLKRYYMKGLPKGTYSIEAFYNWDNRYGDADITEIVGVHK